MGGMLWLLGKRKVGLYTFLAGVCWTAIAFLLIRPLFTSPDLSQTTATSGNYLTYYFGAISLWQESWLVRLGNGLVVIMPALLLISRAPHWLLPFLAITLPTLLNNGPGPSYD